MTVGRLVRRAPSQAGGGHTRYAGSAEPVRQGDTPHLITIAAARRPHRLVRVWRGSPAPGRRRYWASGTRGSAHFRKRIKQPRHQDTLTFPALACHILFQTGRDHDAESGKVAGPLPTTVADRSAQAPDKRHLARPSTSPAMRPRSSFPNGGVTILRGSARWSGAHRRGTGRRARRPASPPRR